MIITTFHCFGQEKAKKTPEEKATSITKKLTGKLSLDPEQAAKVKAISLVKAQKMDEAKSNAAADNNTKSTEFKSLKQKWEADLKGILTTAQFESYIKYKEEKKADKKASQAGKTKKDVPSKTSVDDKMRTWINLQQ